MELTEKQIAELVGVFRAEAIENVKALAEVLLAIDREKTGDFREPLSRAFREAHSLKGSAGTLGFGRVEQLAARMEELLGILARGEMAATPDAVYALLTALDAIRVAVGESAPGDSRLAPEESAANEELGRLILESRRSGAPEQEPPSVAPAPQSAALPGLADEQFERLVAVFRAESLEHIKALAETLFNLEEDLGDRSELLTSAFREAHSMKGAASTLGFGRVERLTHRLEDVLGQMRIQGDRMRAPDIDILLSALDLIHKAVETSRVGDDALTGEEVDVARALKLRVKQLAEEQLKGVTSNPPAIDAGLSEAPPSAAGDSGQPAPEEPPRETETVAERAREAFIRIAESKVEAVIVQVGELFEANLKIESLVPEFKRFSETASELVEAMELTRIDLGNTPYETDFHLLFERMRNLSFQLQTAVSIFERDGKQLSKLVQSSQDELHKIRLAPVSTIFVMIRQQVREMSRVTGKPLEVYLGGGEWAVDRKVLDAIEEPLVHILRNAADHGIEEPDLRAAAHKEPTGRIGVTVRHAGDSVELTVTDDGRGIDPEQIRRALVEKKIATTARAQNLSSDQLFDYLFESGFSTRQGVSKMSGRGVGLDVVKYTVERLGGEVRLETKSGKGTAITLRLPLVMSTIRCLLVRVSGKLFAIPASNVERVIVPRSDVVKTLGGGNVVVYLDQNIPLGSLGDILGLVSHAQGRPAQQRPVVVLAFGDRHFAFAVDELIEYAQVILKPLGDLLERVPNISGVSLLGTGEVALVLNPADLVRAAGGGVRARVSSAAASEAPLAGSRKVLVVDDSIATRTLEKTLLESAGFTVLTAADGYKALDILASNLCDVVISDVQMPNMDGIELTRTIKSRRHLAHLPVILVTSRGSDEDKEKGLAAGADAYIVKKELTQRELVETINQLL